MSRGNTELVLPRAPHARRGQQQVIRQRAEEAVQRVCANEDYRAKVLSELAQYGRREQANIIGKAAKKLAAFRAREREARKQYGVWSSQQRMAHKTEFLRYAQSLGVNIDALFRLHAYVRKRAALLMNDSTRSSIALAPDPPGDSFDRNCVTVTHPFDSLGQFSTSSTEFEGPFELRTFESYMNRHLDVTGGYIEVSRHDAGDFESAHLELENGFLSCYITENRASMIKITARFQWVDDGYVYVETSDEWGWSDCYISIDSEARFAVFLAELGDLYIETVPLHWWYYHGDGEDPRDSDEYESWFPHPAISTVSRPGDISTVSCIIPQVIPRSTIVGIYVGTRQNVNCTLNDVSIRAYCYAKLQLLDYRVCQV